MYDVRGAGHDGDLLLVLRTSHHDPIRNKEKHWYAIIRVGLKANAALLPNPHHKGHNQ